MAWFENGETRTDPEIREELNRSRAGLEAKDIDAIDAALDRIQSLPLTGKTSHAVSEIADFVLTMDFQKALDAMAGLPGRGS